MIIEAAPRAFEAHEVSAAELLRLDSTSRPTSPVQLLNQAWRIFLNNEDSYTEWEKKAIEVLMNDTSFV
jgi:hypothetical protein